MLLFTWHVQNRQIYTRDRRQVGGCLRLRGHGGVDAGDSQCQGFLLQGNENVLKSTVVTVAQPSD